MLEVVLQERRLGYLEQYYEMIDSIPTFLLFFYVSKLTAAVETVLIKLESMYTYIIFIIFTDYSEYLYKAISNTQYL